MPPYDAQQPLLTPPSDERCGYENERLQSRVLIECCLDYYCLDYYSCILEHLYGLIYHINFPSLASIRLFLPHTRRHEARETD